MKHLPIKKPGQVITGKDWNMMREYVNQCTITCGPGIETKRTSAGMSVSLVDSPLKNITSSGNRNLWNVICFPAVILERYGQGDYTDPILNTLAPDGPNKWLYSWHMCDAKLVPYEGAWIQVDGNYGTTPADQVYPSEFFGSWGWIFYDKDKNFRDAASQYSKNGIPFRGWGYNLCEAHNSAYGMQGNSVDIDRLQDTSPNMALMPVPLGATVLIYVASDGVDTNFYFSYENGIDGVC